jgi:N6-L-threonylcarbamoyladenine synthase
MLILAIETSCDETAISLLEAEGNITAPKFKILKQTVSSQIKIHAPFGGVVPSLAKREHQRNLPLLFARVIGKDKAADAVMKKVDLIAVTVGPGLEPALWTGIVFAQEISKKFNKPLLGANHLEGHLFSFLLGQERKLAISKQQSANGHSLTSKPPATYHLPLTNIFPAVALIVSGGHTIILRVDSLSKWKRLGETRDDAAGEAYDKVARMLDLPYPGGPNMEKLALMGNPQAVKFPRPMLYDKNFDFSFSGLKTSVLYYLRDKWPVASGQKKTKGELLATGHYSLTTAAKADVAASFQNAVVDVLAGKTMKAASVIGAKSVLLSGGVAANKALRKRLTIESKKMSIPFFAPPMKFNGDNASMIGVAAYLQDLRKKKRPLKANGQMEI